MSEETAQPAAESAPGAEAAPLPAADSEAWRRVQLARHPQRPNFLDWLPALCADFAELHGDRRFGDDGAIVAGMARFRGREVLMVGQQKGREIKEKIRRNFGMPQPEGYRKALRLMQLAEKFGRPILSFIDTNGAHPGLDAEERGQAEAIAFNLREMARLRVPILATITGEGGSGGALAIAVGNRVLMLENAIYSVITPEGCASITWRDANMKARAAAALKPTAADMLQLGLIDEVVPEPPGGAHTDPAAAALLLGDVLERHLVELQRLGPERVVQDRYERFRRMGGEFVKEGDG
ncbi:MAG TPA: acetyl-CoA carboxylase carboxyltransferase subunit alpha [Terriglobales bacterium]|nr:acetyl-CoA carboxylase carboxyltransferase subunit alpha [Terriglobales bacterium]